MLMLRLQGDVWSVVLSNSSDTSDVVRPPLSWSARLSLFYALEGRLRCTASRGCRRCYRGGRLCGGYREAIGRSGGGGGFPCCSKQQKASLITVGNIFLRAKDELRRGYRHQRRCCRLSCRTPLVCCRAMVARYIATAQALQDSGSRLRRRVCCFSRARRLATTVVAACEPGSNSTPRASILLRCFEQLVREAMYLAIMAREQTKGYATSESNAIGADGRDSTCGY